MGRLLSFRSIRSKMIFGFSIVILLVVILASYNFTILNNSNTTVESIIDEELPMFIADEKITRTLYERIASARGFVLTGDHSHREQFDAATQESRDYTDIAREIGVSAGFEDLIQRTVEWRENIEDHVFQVYEQGNTELALENLVKADMEVDILANDYEAYALDRENHIIELEENILAEGQTTIKIVTVVSVLVVLVGMAIAMITSNSIARPLGSVTNRMELIASGDLSGEALETTLRDEIGHLVDSTNKMTDTTRNLLQQINGVSGTVTSQSEELTQSANEVRVGSEQIAITMEELASGAESQANHSNELSSMMASFVTQIENMSTNAENIQGSSEQIIQMTADGSHLMEGSTKQMETIDHIVREAVTKVEGLDQHSQEISEIVSVIQDIAAQTNLLALNAAIEAARAGEHGQGFAVVADEVRQLAEQSANSVTNITNIVERIQTESSVVAASLHEGYREVEQGTEQIETTSETFHEISHALSGMVASIMEVSANISEIVANSQEMNSSIQEIAAVSEESAAGVEETSATSEQSSSAMEEVAASSNDLARLAEELNELVLQFRL